VIGEAPSILGAGTYCAIREVVSSTFVLLSLWKPRMQKIIKTRKAGGSVSATLPKEMAERFHIVAGEKVHAIETDRGILITPYDPEFDEAVEVYRRGARKYRNALRELSK